MSGEKSKKEWLTDNRNFKGRVLATEKEMIAYLSNLSIPILDDTKKYIFERTNEGCLNIIFPFIHILSTGNSLM